MFGYACWDATANFAANDERCLKRVLGVMMNSDIASWSSNGVKLKKRYSC